MRFVVSIFEEYENLAVSSRSQRYRDDTPDIHISVEGIVDDAIRVQSIQTGGGREQIRRNRTQSKEPAIGQRLDCVNVRIVHFESLSAGPESRVESSAYSKTA